MFPWIPKNQLPSFRPLEPSDMGAVSILLDTCSRSHRHPEWRDSVEWIGRSPAWGAFFRQVPVAALITSASPLPAAWVRAAAVADHLPGDWNTVLQQLFQHCLEELGALHASTLSIMPGVSWPGGALDELGFRIVEEVETWGWTGRASLPAGNPEVTIRPVLERDLEKLEHIEKLAFHPRWRYNVELLRLARLGAASMLLAEQLGEIHGFAISLYAGNKAHLARLTVAPAVQHSGIGSRLLAATFAQYAADGIQMVTLNTQTDNLASHRLYTAFGFERVSPPIPVWERPV